MQEDSTRFAVHESPMPVMEISCLNAALKTCIKPASSPQLGDYSAPVLQAHFTLNQPEKAFGMPLDGERTARLKRAKHASPARLLQAEPSRKRRAATKAEPAPAKARPEPGSPEALGQRAGHQQHIGALLRCIRAAAKAAPGLRSCWRGL